MDTTARQLQTRLAVAEAMAAHIKKTGKQLQDRADGAEGKINARTHVLAQQIRKAGVGADPEAEKEYCRLLALKLRLGQTHSLAGQTVEKLGDVPDDHLAKARRRAAPVHHSQGALLFDEDSHPRLSAGGTLPGYRPGEFVPKPAHGSAPEAAPEDGGHAAATAPAPDRLQTRRYAPDDVRVAADAADWDTLAVQGYSDQYRENPEDVFPVTLVRHGGGLDVLDGVERVLGAQDAGQPLNGVEIPEEVHHALRGMGYTDAEISYAVLGQAREYDAQDELAFDSGEPSFQRRGDDAERHLGKLLAGRTEEPAAKPEPEAVADQLAEIHGEEEGIDPGQDWKERGTRALAFREWFGDWVNSPETASKVVNEKTGEPQEEYNLTPMPVFHGTKAGGFRYFNPHQMSDYNIFGAGFYFTEDRGIAEEYTEKDADDNSSLVAATVGFRDAKTGEVITHLDKKRAEKYINTPHNEAFEDRAMLNNGNWHPYIKASLEAAMEPEGVNVQKFLDALGEEHNTKKYYVYGEEKSRMRGMLRGAGIAAFAREWGNLKPIIPDPEVKEVYLNVRKPFDMDEPISQEEIDSFIDFISERMKGATGNPRWHWFNDDLLRREDDEREFPDGFPLKPTIADFMRIKQIAMPYKRNERDAQGNWKETDRPLHGIFHLDPDTLTKGDFHYIISDGHHLTGERRIFTDWVKSRGHDGIAHTGGWNIGTKNHRVWITFSPEQIKATSNEGTFDPTNWDMYKGPRPEFVPPDVPRWRSKRPNHDTFIPLNGVENRDKFREMCDQMERGDWEWTVPLIRCGDQLITGSHRYNACRETGTPIETKTLDELFRENGLSLRDEWTARAQPFAGWISNIDFALQALPEEVLDHYGIDLG